MRSALISIFIIGDDATTNLMSGFILRGYFGNPDIHYFSNPNDALRSILSTGIFAPPTLIFLDSHSNGMTWQTFLQQFSALAEAVQGRYRVFISASAVSAKKSPDLPHFPKATLAPWPLSLAVLHELGAKNLFRHYPPNSISLQQGSKTDRQLQQSRK